MSRGHDSRLRRLCRNEPFAAPRRTERPRSPAKRSGLPATPGRRLPNHDELLTAVGNPGITIAPAGELTREVFPSATPGRVDVLYVTDDVGSVALTPNTAAGAKPFRCVTDPLN